MPNRSNLLSKHPGFTSRRVEEVKGRVTKLFGVTRFEAPPNGKACNAHYLRLNDVNLIHVQYPERHSVSFAEASFVRQYFALGGSGRFSTGRRTGEISVASPAPIIPAGTPL